MSQPQPGYPGDPRYGVAHPPQTYGQVQPHYGQPGSAVQPYQPAPPPAPYAQAYFDPYAARYQLVSAGGRFGAMLLDALLIVVTLGIGWFIWSLIVWSGGQSPAKQMLGHVVADSNTGEPVDWVRMFLREICVKGLLAMLLNFVSFGIYFWVDSFMVFGDRQRSLHDRMSNSVVRHR